MGRILAIDYGKRRTGIAVTDPLQLIANGLTTVDTKTLYDFLADYMQREDVERIVVGLPKQNDGSPSENMCRIEPFVNRLRKLYPTLAIEMYDERFPSTPKVLVNAFVCRPGWLIEMECMATKRISNQAFAAF